MSQGKANMRSSAYVSPNLDSGRTHAWQLAGELSHLLGLKRFILPGHWGEAAHAIDNSYIEILKFNVCSS